MMRTLDLFILMLVRDGLSSPYLWQARAGVSLGASLPAVRRLLDGGLVSEAEGEHRGRREFTITRPGLGELKNINQHLENNLDRPKADLETVLRLVCIAITENKPELAGKLLLQAAEKHAKRFRLARKLASAPLKHSRLSELYAAVFARCDARVENATAESLADLISVLGLDSKQTSPVRRRRKSLL
jgi:DNA-binding PadR family transcriptional regulator